MSDSVEDVSLGRLSVSGRSNLYLDLDSLNHDPALLFSTEFAGDADAAGDGAFIERAFASLSERPGRLDPDALTLIEDVLQTNILDEAAGIDFQHCCQQILPEQPQEKENEGQGGRDLQQPYSSGRTDSLGSVSPLYETTPRSTDQIDTQLKQAMPSSTFSNNSEAAKKSSTTDSLGPEANVYTSITATPLQGRALDFRSFLSKKQVPPAILKEGSVGVFVGQLPSTYSEEDSAALLRAIGADAGVPVHVRDVKSHNQSRTCAFVVVNRSALPVLLGYSKRVLCDVSCVWVVGREQAVHLKYYINGFLRDRLRGVPKAALVLEELTPQYMRSRTSAGKGGKSSNRQKGNVTSASENVFMGTHDGNPIVTHPFAMNFLLPGWNSMDAPGLSFCPVFNNTGAPPLVNTNSASNVPGVIQTNGFSAAPSPSLVAPAPQVNYYVIGGPPNGLQGIAPGQVNGQVLSPPPTANGGGKGGSNGVANGASSSENLLPSFLPGIRAAHDHAPSSQKLPEGVSRCSVCSATFGPAEPQYFFPQDNTVRCTRCSSQRVASGDASQATRGMATFIMPQSNLGGFPQPSTGNTTMLLHALPPYMPLPHPQNQFLPQLSQLPLPQQQQQHGYTVGSGW
ncbi:uncharacterized protein Tco025E_05436 [Trypanosoma conorhini]|uniref:Uncharacterized protein n=1 Tax=Trypanosoma conorhini TaxID=83891 RepID=A0A3R7MIR5_9TRYP|nr:uncharacterized protein Tco025E_05436 [Trypanosoma conorhini]RNF15847.1 hypothetical protein Tco025E_05436 [Trypanosoma conorhini]